MPDTQAYKDLYARATAAYEQAKALVAKADEENRDLTAEECARVEELYKECEQCKLEGDRAKAKAMVVDADKLVNHDPTPGVSPEDLSKYAPSGVRKVEAEPKDREKEMRHGFRDFGEFACAVRGWMDPSIGSRDDRLTFYSAGTGMEQATGSKGGFTVPPTFSTAIWDGLNQGTQNLLGMTDNYTVTGESITFNGNAETSRATGSRYGGIQGYWLNEADAITASYPKVRQIKIEPHELAVLVYVTDKLLNNSAVALEQYLTRAATDEIQFLVGDSIINGTGGNQPLGILNAGCLVTVAKETSQAADSIKTENLSKMWARLHPRSQANAVWLVNGDVQPELDNLFLGVKNVAGSENVGGLNTWIYNPQTNSIKGRPVVPIEYCATLGDAGDIILADMSGYLTGTRGGVNSAMSIHLRFNYAESCFRFMFAVDGQPWLASALTPYKGTNTLSHFVNLAARA